MNFIFYCFLVFYFILPFQFALNLTENFDIATIRVFAMTIFIIFCFWSLYKKNFFVAKGWISILFTFFFMWIFFSPFFTPVPEWTIRKIIFFISFLPLFYILVALFQYNKIALITVIKSLVCGATLASLIAFIQFSLQFIISLNATLVLWSHISPFFLGNMFASSVVTYNSWLVHVGNKDLMRGIAFFPDPHVASFYFGIITPFAAGLYYHTKKWHYLICAVFIVIADLLTFSRGGYIGLLAGVTCALILFWSRLHTKVQHIITLLLISSVLLFCIPQNPITQRFLSSFDSSDTSTTQRVELWSQAISTISQKPFLGTGLGAYPYIINPLADYRTPIYAHNIYLDICVELGLIGFFTFFGAIIFSIYIFLKNKDKLFSYFAIISIVIFLTHAIFDTPIYSVHILPILLLIIAIASHHENSVYKNI